MQVNVWYQPKNHRRLIQKLEDWLPNKILVVLIVIGYQSSIYLLLEWFCFHFFFTFYHENFSDKKKRNLAKFI